MGILKLYQSACLLGLSFSLLIKPERNEPQPCNRLIRYVTSFCSCAGEPTNASFSPLLQTLLKAGEQCWSLAELVQAVVILAHCHSLCSFVCGCDVNPDFVLFSKSPNDTLPAFSPYDAANGNTNVPQSLAAPSEHRTRRRVNKPDLDLVYNDVTMLFRWQLEHFCCGFTKIMRVRNDIDKMIFMLNEQIPWF